MSTETTVVEEIIPFDRNGTESSMDFAKRVVMQLYKLCNREIFSTVGVYPNSDTLKACKTNGVTWDRLMPHIWYNITHRPGRALYVNGVLVYGGTCQPPSDELLAAIKAVKHTYCTAPYH